MSRLTAVDEKIASGQAALDAHVSACRDALARCEDGQVAAAGSAFEPASAVAKDARGAALTAQARVKEDLRQNLGKERQNTRRNRWQRCLLWRLQRQRGLQRFWNRIWPPWPFRGRDRNHED